MIGKSLTLHLLVCGNLFNVDHVVVCKHGGFIIQRQNEHHNLEAEMFNMLCHNVEVEPVLQETTGEDSIEGPIKPLIFT